MLSHPVLDAEGPRRVSALDASSSTQRYGKVVPTDPALAMPSEMTLALFPARCLLGRVQPPTAGYQSSPDSAVPHQLLTLLRYQVQACSWRTRASDTWSASEARLLQFQFHILDSRFYIFLGRHCPSLHLVHHHRV